jgi:hypothetical protein
MSSLRSGRHGNYAHVNEQGAVGETVVRLTIFKSHFSDTHRSADGTTRNDELNTLVPFETVDATRGNEVRCILRTTQDLKQNWDIGCLEGNPVDLKQEGGKVLTSI